jgi:hypothetical protein
MMLNLKGFGRKRSWPNLKILSRHSPGGSEKAHEKTPMRISGRRGQDLNPGPPEYEERVLTTRPRLSMTGLNDFDK